MKESKQQGLFKTALILILSSCIFYRVVIAAECEFPQCYPGLPVTPVTITQDGGKIYLDGHTSFCSCSILISPNSTIVTGGNNLSVVAEDRLIIGSNSRIVSFENPAKSGDSEVNLNGENGYRYGADSGPKAPGNEMAGTAEDGADGGDGEKGQDGQDGIRGKNAGEIRIYAGNSIVGKIFLRNSGQDGGDGEAGGNGGHGGNGQQGGRGESGVLNCKSGAGQGGEAGSGGEPGKGGVGGIGGNGGKIVLESPVELSWFEHLDIDVSPGKGGVDGAHGLPGNGGKGGYGGRGSQFCEGEETSRKADDKGRAKNWEELDYPEPRKRNDGKSGMDTRLIVSE